MLPWSISFNPHEDYPLRQALLLPFVVEDTKTKEASHLPKQYSKEPGPALSPGVAGSRAHTAPPILHSPWPQGPTSSGSAPHFVDVPREELYPWIQDIEEQTCWAIQSPTPAPRSLSALSPTMPVRRGQARANPLSSRKTYPASPGVSSFSFILLT